MRIHLSLDPDTALKAIRNAADQARVTIPDTPTFHGSRTHAGAVTVNLSGSSARRARMGRAPYRAATWDEWGMFLSALFDADPTARTGDYDSQKHFNWATGGRFDMRKFPVLTPQDTHRQHRFTFTGNAATNAYRLYTCDTCSATLRRPNGNTPAERASNLANILEN